ncbi:hypothetical protein AB0D30_21070 [Streptomyces sp. NPDC048409]|uniref:hypothetical protein n=1 Tax=Streptomyces sp. NPDC048409 TaxID=3154723 RepID=UPI0034158A16
MGMEELGPSQAAHIERAIEKLLSSDAITGASRDNGFRLTSTPKVLTSSGLHVDGPSTVVTVVTDHKLRLLRIVDIEQIYDTAPLPPPVRTARSATGLAAYIAGESRPHLQAEWTSILAGSPENGLALAPMRQRLMAIGFLVAALRMRMRDMARPAWRPVDWLLGTANRTNGLIAYAVGAQAVYIVGHEGVSALATGAAEPCAFTAGALYALARWLRKVRGIELASPTRESVDE